jgi:hypothetical protein
VSIFNLKDYFEACRFAEDYSPIWRFWVTDGEEATYIIRCPAACMPMCGMMGTESIIPRSSSRSGAPYGSSGSAKAWSCLCCPFRASRSNATG